MATTPDAADGRAGLAPTRAVLDNGLTVMTKETRKTPAVAIHLAVRAGSVCDPPDSPGMAHLLSRVIDRGTLTRSADDVATELDDRGVSLAVGAARHLVSMACTCLADDFEPVMALLADIVRRPSLPTDQLDTRRGEAITGLRQDEDNPYVRAGDGLMALLYGEEHPYGRHVRGTVTSLERIERGDLLRFHAEHFTPSAAGLVVVGDVGPARVIDVASSAFGSWQPSGAAQTPPRVADPSSRTTRRTNVIPMPYKAQAEIAYGFITVARTDPDHDAIWLLNHVLGQYALGGRLGDSIRERQGMAYHVASAFEPGLAAGPLLVRAGVSAANVDRAIQSIDEEVSAVVNGGITAAELEDSRRYLIGSLPLGLETNEGITQFLQTAEFFGLGLDYDVRLPALLRAVTLDRVHAVARRYMKTEFASVVVAGPYARG